MSKLPRIDETTNDEKVAYRFELSFKGLLLSAYEMKDLTNRFSFYSDLSIPIASTRRSLLLYRFLNHWT